MITKKDLVLEMLVIGIFAGLLVVSLIAALVFTINVGFWVGIVGLILFEVVMFYSFVDVYRDIEGEEEEREEE